MNSAPLLASRAAAVATASRGSTFRPSAIMRKRASASSAAAQPSACSRPVVTMSRPMAQMDFSFCRVAATRRLAFIDHQAHGIGADIDNGDRPARLGGGAWRLQVGAKIA